MVHQVSSDVELKNHLVGAGSTLVVVDFFNKQCSHCIKIAPVFEDFSEKMPNVVFLKVEVKESPDLATQYNATATPTFVFFKNTQEVDRVKGAKKEMLEALIQRNSR